MPGEHGWSGAGSNRRPSAFQAGNSTWWYVADLQTHGPEWSGKVPSGVVDGSHLVSHETARSFIVRTPERASEPGPQVPRQPARQAGSRARSPTARLHYVPSCREDGPLPGLAEFLAAVPDRRRAQGRRHTLVSILALACAAAGGTCSMTLEGPE